MLRLFRQVVLSGAILAGFAGAGAAQAADLPKLYFANGLDAAVSVTVDDHALGQLPAKTVNTVALTPGEHVILVTMQDGSSVSKPYTLDTASLADSKGAKWWCIVVAPKSAGSDQGFLFQFPTANCKAFVDAGS